MSAHSSAVDSPLAAHDLPIAAPLPAGLEAEQVFRRLAARPHCLFLDSAQRDPVLGRYSFVAADPFAMLHVPADGSDALAELAGRLAPFRAATAAGLPPFQGGAAGVWAYDLNRSLERIPRPAYDEFQTPALAIGLYDTVVAFDHVDGGAWIVSQGFPELQAESRRRRALERIAQFQAWLDEPLQTPSPRAWPPQSAEPALSADRLARHFAVPGFADLTSNLSPAAYRAAVERAIEYIRAGDIFQVNLAQRLLLPAEDHPVNLYLRLRARNPAPFAGYFDAGSFQVASASPERFLKLSGGEVETRPIKGTRRRTRRPEADLFAGDELEQSEKDRAENVMIVDLLRNDLARVCRPDSVRVTQLCRLEIFEFVQHLVSAVRGTLSESYGPIDLVRATFPGGSITGAPKVRAMEIIAELEPTARGTYCGALGYIGFDGALDTNLLIRTITASRGWWQAPVGGGIVAQSHPEREYEETWHKAAGLIKSLR
jgi:para-aminobenzoate synthetase component I